jgi:hypothetical protein
LIINISAGLILQKGFKVNENFEADNNFHNGAITPGIAIKKMMIWHAEFAKDLLSLNIYKSFVKYC